MFEFIRRKKIENYVIKATRYLEKHYEPFVYYSDRDDRIQYSDRSDVQYSDRDTSCDEYKPREKSKISDPYVALDITKGLRGMFRAEDLKGIHRVLDQNVNQSFVDKLLYHINQKGLRDSEVYKAAQVDKRLFSKMVSNRDYKPSKDTAIALAFALRLSLDEANDLLSRAGYTFSHSNKRDIIIEYFFREGICNLLDVNEVLYRLDQKIIGRL